MIDPDVREVLLPLEHRPLPGRLYVPRFNPDNLGPFPAVVVCHGNTALGQDCPLIVQLAQRLAAAGSIALTFDNLGYNRGWRPPSGVITSPEEIDLRWGAFAAVSLLFSLPEVDRRRIFLAGHSMGGAVALSAGAVDVRVRGMAGLSPTMVRQHITTPTDREHYRREKLSGSTLDLYLSQNVVHAMRLVTDPERYLPELSQKPLLLVGGAQERDDYLTWLQSLAAKIDSPACRVHTIDSAGHYYGTPPNSESPAAFTAVSDLLLTWLSTH